MTSCCVGNTPYYPILKKYTLSYLVLLCLDLGSMLMVYNRARMRQDDILGFQRMYAKNRAGWATVRTVWSVLQD